MKLFQEKYISLILPRISNFLLHFFFTMMEHVLSLLTSAN